MDEIIDILIDTSSEGERLDKCISKNIKSLTRSYVQKLVENKCVMVNGQLIDDKNFRVKENQNIKIFLPEPETLSLKPEKIPLDVVYEDADLLVVNKQKGMVVHPAVGNYSGTLVNALLHYCGETLSSINGTIRPGIVHRIDKDTSGLLIVAKNDFSHKNLSEQIKEHSFFREYEAVVYGNLKEDKGTINEAISRHKIDRKKMAVAINGQGKSAITHYVVLKRYKNFTHIRLKLETGRTHQIRVHMSYVGHPVAGDLVYGPKNNIKILNGQCLHAKYIGFVHPRTLKYMEFESNLPEYFKNFLKTLKI